jgi:hypothetical protein
MTFLRMRHDVYLSAFDYLNQYFDLPNGTADSFLFPIEKCKRDSIGLCLIAINCNSEIIHFLEETLGSEIITEEIYKSNDVSTL